MNDPVISVIVPCYNQAHFLPEAFASLQAQTFPAWECIVVNDGSTDGTKAVAEGLVAADGRVRLVNQPNRGLAGARNRGLAEARGEYIQFLDADDALMPEKFELQLAAVDAAKKTAVVYCDYYASEFQDLRRPLPEAYMDPRFRTSEWLPECAARWEAGLSIPCHCFLFDARFFGIQWIRFDESLPNHEDWDCWMRILALKPSVKFVDAKLAIYRKHPDSMAHDYGRMRGGFLRAIDKQIGFFKRDPKMLAILKQKRRETRRAYRRHSPAYRMCDALASPFRTVRRAGVIGFKRVLPAHWVGWLKEIRGKGVKGKDLLEKRT